jgi:sarcosine oxidase subunit alpha
VQAFEGESISGVMLAMGRRVFRHTTKSQQPRSIFCGIGVCYDCVVTVNGTPNVRACLTMVEDGMKIETRAKAES